MNITKELADVAADWWAAQIDGMPTDAGLDTASASFFNSVRSRMALDTAPSQDQLAGFKAALAAGIIAEAKGYTYDMCIMVDYQPENACLVDALDAVGMDAVVMPIKTKMWIGADGQIRVKRGYGAAIETIRPADAQPAPAPASPEGGEA